MTTIDFCLEDYDKILSLQKKIVREKKIQKDKSGVLLLGEHFHVITVGKRPQQRENLKISVPAILSKDIKIRKIQRGGFATYHGPGQLVGYPIFNLRKNKIGIKKFIEKLEESIISTLEEFDISGRRESGYIGVWVENKKIASIGVGVKRGITFHGFALNINTDLNYFNYIIPCGLNEIQMTSMEQVMNKKVSLDKVKHVIAEKISKVYNKNNNCCGKDEIKSILR